MKLTLAQLEAFYWIVQLGSFHAAARYLNLSQPAISVRIRELERAVGQTIFERRGREIRITAAGAGLADHAERMLALAKDMTGEQLVFDPVQAGLRLGAPDSFAQVCLPMMLALIERDYPELRLALTIENSAVLNRRLNDGELDLAFLSEPQLGSEFRTELLGRQDIAWVASPRLGLAMRAIRPADLTGHHVFTNDEGSRLYQLVRSWFSESGLAPTRISTCNSLSVIVRLSAKGGGSEYIADVDSPVRTAKRRTSPPDNPSCLAAPRVIRGLPAGVLWPRDPDGD